jgi:hypothetical protein
MDDGEAKPYFAELFSNRKIIRTDRLRCQIK